MCIRDSRHALLIVHFRGNDHGRILRDPVIDGLVLGIRSVHRTRLDLVGPMAVDQFGAAEQPVLEIIELRLLDILKREIGAQKAGAALLGCDGCLLYTSYSRDARLFTLSGCGPKRCCRTDLN